MKRNAVKTIRLPQQLVDRVEEEIENTGISFVDFTIDALKLALGDDTGDPTLPFLRKLADRLESNFSPTEFPADITLQVFHWIRDEPELKREYDKLIRSGDRVDGEKLTGLHRRIGMMVKRVLDAEVMGRSVPLNPKEHLVRTHSLLRPRGGAK